MQHGSIRALKQQAGYGMPPYLLILQRYFIRLGDSSVPMPMELRAMNLQIQSKFYSIFACVPLLLTNGCAVYQQLPEWDTAFAEESAAIIIVDQEVSRRQQALIELLPMATTLTSVPALPEIELGLLFDEDPVSVRNVLTRWRLAELELDAARRELDYLSSVVSTEEQFLASLDLPELMGNDTSVWSALRETLSTVVVGMTSQLEPLQEQLGRINSRGWQFAKVSGVDPDAELKSMGVGGLASPAINERDIDALVDAVQQLSFNLAGQAQDLSHVERDLVAVHAAQPLGKPLDAAITSRFGARSDPFTGRRTSHKGLDMGAPKGTPINAVAAGRVVFSGTRAGYGRLVELDHGNGYRTRYAHNSRNVVKTGQLVSRGDTIAKVGRSGRSTGPHLHFEVLVNGAQVDPMRFVRATP